jgi:hypothetical protein
MAGVVLAMMVQGIWPYGADTPLPPVCLPNDAYVSAAWSSWPAVGERRVDIHGALDREMGVFRLADDRSFRSRSGATAANLG